MHPVLILVDSDSDAHAIVAVRIDIDLTPSRGAASGGALWYAPPTDAHWWTLPQQIGTLAELDDLVTIDPLGLAAPLQGSLRTGFDSHLLASVNSSAEYLNGAGWVWRVAVDVGAMWRDSDVHRPLPPAEPTRHGRQSGTPTNANAAPSLTDLVRVKVFDFIDRETEIRGITDDHWIETSWDLWSRGRRVDDPITQELTLTMQTASTVALAGVTDRLIDGQVRLLVVAGPSGFGKSTMLIVLIRRILEDSRRLLPIFTTARSWPAEATIGGWLETQVRELLPKAAGEVVEAAILQSEQRFVPVIDGLDDLSRKEQMRLLAEIQRYARTDRPVIISVNGEEIQGIPAELRSTNTLVMRANSVESDAAVDYLSRTIALERRPDPKSDVGVAEVSISPFYLSLIPHAISVSDVGLPPNEPADVLKDQLLGSLIPSLHLKSLDVPLGSRPWRRWTSEDIQRWSGNLALHLAHSQLVDIWIWQIPQALGFWSRFGVGFVAAMLGYATAVLIPQATFGIGLGVLGSAILAIGFLAVTRLVRRRRPHGQPSAPVEKVKQSAVGRLRPRGPLHTIVFSGVAGLVGGQTIDLLISGRVPATSNQIVVGSPSILNASLGLAISAGVAYLLARLDWAPMTAIYVEEDREGKTSALEAARVDKLRTLVFLGVFVVLLVCSIYAFGYFAGTLLSTVVTAFLMMVVFQGLPNGAWLSFAIARIILAGSHRFPLRLISFLEDSHSAELLRGIPGGYQFRHSKVQAYLVSQGESSSSGPDMP